MKSPLKSPMAGLLKSPSVMRAGLFVLAVMQGIVGIWALLGPESFFANFPAPGTPGWRSCRNTTSTSPGMWGR